MMSTWGVSRSGGDEGLAAELAADRGRGATDWNGRLVPLWFFFLPDGGGAGDLDDALGSSRTQGTV